MPLWSRANDVAVSVAGKSATLRDRDKRPTNISLSASDDSRRNTLSVQGPDSVVCRTITTTSSDIFVADQMNAVHFRRQANLRRRLVTDAMNLISHSAFAVKPFESTLTITHDGNEASS